MSFTTTALLTGVPTAAAETDVSSTDELYGALAHERRRAVLEAITDGEELTVEALAERLLEDDGSGPSASAESRERVTISLVHVHLPKLAAVGLIEYDRDRNRVRAR